MKGWKNTHPNINLFTEVKPSKFLEKKSCDNNEIKSFAYHKETNFLSHWMSAVRKHYWKNIIIGDLHHVKNLISNFEQKVREIKDKYIKASCHFHFISSAIDGFNQEEDLLILTSLFVETKVSFQILFCKQDENEISRIIDKLEALTNTKRTLGSIKERKKVSFQIPFCKRNENEIFRIIDKLQALTNYKVKLGIFGKEKRLVFSVF